MFIWSFGVLYVLPASVGGFRRLRGAETQRLATRHPHPCETKQKPESHVHVGFVSIHLHIHLSVYPSVYLSAYLSVFLPMHLDRYVGRYIDG